MSGRPYAEVVNTPHTHPNWKQPNCHVIRCSVCQQDSTVEVQIKSSPSNIVEINTHSIKRALSRDSQRRRFDLC